MLDDVETIDSCVTKCTDLHSCKEHLKRTLMLWYLMCEYTTTNQKIISLFLIRTVFLNRIGEICIQ
jgi:hypothetical protein